MIHKITLNDVVICKNDSKLLKVHSLEIGVRRVLAVLGDNGSGKTSFLRVLAGLETGYSGNIHYGDIPHSVFFKGRSHPKDLLMVAQEPVMFHTTVEKNIAFGLRHVRLTSQQRRRQTEEIMEALQIRHLAGRKAYQLSGGETRRVALARALVMRPGFLLLDEPFSGIDRENLEGLEQLLQKLISESIIHSLVFSTHQEDVALRMTPDILQIHNHQLVLYHPCNVFRGIGMATADSWLFKTSDLVLEIPSFSSPPRMIHVPPTDIILSRTSFESTARNNFAGTIISMAQKDSMVDIPLKAGVLFVARITLRSLGEYGFTIGEKVFLHFKTSAIRFLGQDAVPNPSE